VKIGLVVQLNSTSRKYFQYMFGYIWNYGSKKESEQIHYVNVGGAYRIGAYRVAVNYGRQRGGLVCVGGVCRFVPESSGFTLNFNTSFRFF